jgi:hypothetical protein
MENRILKMVQYLLEADANNSEFIEVKGDPKKGPGLGWVMNVKVISPNKEWDYFGINVKIDTDKAVIKNGEVIGKLEKNARGYEVVMPDGANSIINGKEDLTRETIIEAVFQFIKFYFSDM